MLWTALALGLAGSLHCAGMCGPLMLVLPAGGSRVRFVSGRLAYHAGRLGTYAALGLVFGLLGRSLAVFGVQRWVSLVAGILMLLALAALLPRQMAVPALALVGKLKSVVGRLLQHRSVGSLALLGGLNGLLPCGLVYAAAAGAAATGGVVSGVQYMVLFGLGTLPLMLGLSVAGRTLPVAWRIRWLKLVPVTVGVVAVLLILRGLALGVPYLSPILPAGSAVNCH